MSLAILILILSPILRQWVALSAQIGMRKKLYRETMLRFAVKREVSKRSLRMRMASKFPRRQSQS